MPPVLTGCLVVANVWFQTEDPFAAEIGSLTNRARMTDRGESLLHQLAAFICKADEPATAIDVIGGAIDQSITFQS